MSYIGQGLPADTFQGFTTDSFTGDGSATTFTLSKEPFSEDTLIVVINNVIQKPTTNFTVSGTTLTIVGTAVASGDVIYAIHMGGPLPIGGASELDLNGASDKLILDTDGDTTISADTDDQIDFKAGGTDVMSLTASALSVTGTAEFTTTGNVNNFRIISTDAGSSTAPDIVFVRDSASPADGDFLGRVDFRGDDSAGNETNYISLFARANVVTNGSEQGALTFADGDSGNSLLHIQNTEITVNQDSIDMDFRIESNGDANMLKIDAGNDCALFGTTGQSGGEKVSMRSTSNQKMLVIDNANDALAEQVFQIACKRSGVSNYNFLHCISDSNSSADSEFIFAGDGDAFADGTFSNNGADYAEFFETNDGNGIDVGKTVVLDGNKVRASTSSDDASTILGVVRPKVDGINSMIIGNTAWNSWTNKYLHDDYGRFIMEDYSVTEWVVKTYEDGTKQTESYETDKIPEDVTVPDNAVVKTQQRKKFNPAYDKDKEYKPRSERDEWVIIGMLGQIQVTKGQKTGDRWIKMRDISDTVEEWLVR